MATRKYPNEIMRDEHDETINAKKVEIIASNATINAVVNTAAAGQSSVVIDTGENWIGLATVHVSNGGAGGTSATDDSGFTVGTDSGTPFMGIYESTEDTVNDNDVGVVGMTQNRWLKTSQQSTATIFAVVNTSAAGQSSVAIDGNVTVEQGTSPWTSSLKGNVTLDAGSKTGIVGNVTVDQVDVVTAVTDITNPVAIKGNMTLSDSKTFIGLVSVSGFANPLPVDATGQGDVPITLDSEAVVLGAGVAGVGFATVNTANIARTITGNLTLSDSKGYIGLVTVDGLSVDGSNHLQVDIAADSVGIGGGTQYTEDDAVPANPVGNALLAQRDDALGGLTPIEGDWTHLFTDANGALWVHDDSLDAALSGSELQVDIVGALPAGTNAIGKLAANSGVDIGDVDVTSNTAWSDPNTFIGLATTVIGNPGDVGGGTQYTEDDIAVANPVGTQPVFVREDSPTSIAADGDVVAQRSTQYGAGYVQVVDSSGNFVDTFGGGSAPSKADDSAFTVASDNVSPVGAMFDDVSTDSVDEGDVGVLRMSADRRLYTDTEITAALPAGTNAIGKLAANDGVDIGDVDVTSNTAWADPNTFIGLATVEVANTVTVDLGVNNDVTVTGNLTIDQVDLVSALGTGTTGPQKAEDVASANADVGIPAMAVRKATPADTSGADGDYEFLQMDNGRLWTSATIDAAIPAGDNNIGNVDVVSNTAWSDPNTFIGLVSVSGFTTPLPVDATGQGDVPVTLAGENVVLGAGSAAIGKLAANSGVDIGDVDVTSNTAWSDPNTFIGLVTTVYSPPPISTYTSFATQFSATGNHSLFAPPSGKRFVIKDLHVSSLGRSEINIKSNDNILLPYTSLSTTSGFFEHYGEAGLAAQAADDIFALTLNGAATVSLMVNVRFE